MSLQYYFGSSSSATAKNSSADVDGAAGVGGEKIER